MIRIEDYALLGKITKKWGFEGKVVLFTESPFKDPEIFPESVFIALQGKLIPFFIESLQQKSDKTIVVEFIDTGGALTDRIIGCNVYGNLKSSTINTSPETIPELCLDSYSVFDHQHGFIGQVKRIEAREMQPLLLIEHKGTEILIPYAQELITKIDHLQKKIDLCAPEGLIDLYLNP